MARTGAGRARKLRVLGIAMSALWGLGAGVAASTSVAYAQPKPEPKFVLSGVVIDNAGAARALLSEPQWTQGRSVIFAVGDMVGPYRVVSVGPDHAVLEQPGSPPLRVPLSSLGGPGEAESPPGQAVGPARSDPASGRVRGQQSRPESRGELSEEQRKALSAPPADTGKPIYRPAWEGPSTAGPREPAFDADAFKRQLQQQLKGAPTR